MVARHVGALVVQAAYLLAASFIYFFFNDTATTEIYTLSLHDALPIRPPRPDDQLRGPSGPARGAPTGAGHPFDGRRADRCGRACLGDDRRQLDEARAVS